MGQEWYYAVGGQQAGPVDFSHLQQLASTGQLSPGNLVWSEGMPAWSPAVTVPGLMPGAASPSPYATSEAAVPIGYASPTTGLNYFNAGLAPVYAGVWWRFLALIIDGIIVAVANSIVTMGIVGVRSNSLGSSQASQAMQILSSYGMAWLYASLMESSVNQATLGKMAVGIKVTTLAGERISFGRATGRHFAKYLSGMICLIGYLMAFWSDREQALHDQMAGTLVVKK